MSVFPLKENDIYVLVGERDCWDKDHCGGPIVFETDIHNSSLADAKLKQKSIGDRYGRTWIAKLVFD